MNLKKEQELNGLAMSVKKKTNQNINNASFVMNQELKFKVLYKMSRLILKVIKVKLMQMNKKLTPMERN